MSHKYLDIRSRIKTGDVLGVRGHGAFNRLTYVVQCLGGMTEWAGITHVGIAWWFAGRLYSVEMDGRHNVLRPLSQHIASGSGLDVYACPVAKSMPAEFDRATANPINYSLIDLIKIGTRLIFGGGTGRDDDALVCSTFASRWLQWAGWVPPVGFPSMPGPAELCRALRYAVFVVPKRFD